VLSEAASRFASDARFAGEIPGATHLGIAGSPGGGPYMKLWLRVLDSKIVQAGYETYGCPTAMACGSATCQLISGGPVERAKRVTEQDLLVVIGGVPEGKEHCPRLAIEALEKAIGGTKCPA